VEESAWGRPETFWIELVRERANDPGHPRLPANPACQVRTQERTFRQSPHSWDQRGVAASIGST
jgi:hypothetical protein